MTEKSASPLVAREFVRLPLADKSRPTVILAIIDDERAVVIYGTGTERAWPRVEVRPGSREARILELYKPTYFYASNVRIAKKDILQRTNRFCPPDLFLRLREIAERE